MTTDELRSNFEKWYVENAFDYCKDQIGSRDCSLQWNAWQAAHVSRDAEVEALRRDAKRLRFIQHEYQFAVNTRSGGIEDGINLESEYIDAAIAAKEQP